MTEATAGPVGRPALTCRYGQCGRELEYSGRGRPPEYCPDRRWQPGGKTCKQMAAVERDAELAAGLDVPLAAYRAAGERVLPAVEALVGQLSGLADAARAVETGALARVETAERATVEAVERAHGAEAERDRANRVASMAEAAADQAREAQRVAERRARDAERDAERQTTEAWRRVVDAEHAQGRAEAAADERAQAIINETGRREAAEQRAADLADQLKAVRRELKEAQAEVRTTEQARVAAEQRADRAEAAIDAACDDRDAIGVQLIDEQRNVAQLRVDVADARGRLAATADTVTQHAATITQLQAELEAARVATATAEATARAATERAERAEGRIDQFLSQRPAADHQDDEPGSGTSKRQRGR